MRARSSQSRTDDDQHPRSPLHTLEIAPDAKHVRLIIVIAPSRSPVACSGPVALQAHAITQHLPLSPQPQTLNLKTSSDLRYPACNLVQEVYDVIWS